MKKVYVVSSYSPFCNKWLEKVVGSIIKLLYKDFNFITFFISSQKNDRNNNLYSKHCKLIPIKVPHLYWIGYYIYIVINTLRIIRYTNKDDIIIGNNDNLFFLTLLKKFFKRKINIIIQNVKMDYYENNTNLLLWQKLQLQIEKICYKNADSIVAVSDWIKDQLIKHHKIPSNKIKIIYNSINFYKWRIYQRNEKESRILFISNDNYRKGIDTINELWLLLERNNIPIVIEILWPDWNGIKQSNNIVFKWITPNEHIQEYLSKSLLLILPSKNEGLPLVILESISTWTPVLFSTKCNTQMINHIGWVLCDTTEEFYNNIIELYTHETAYLKLQNWAINLTKTIFSEELFSQHYKDYLNSL